MTLGWPSGGFAPGSRTISAMGMFDTYRPIRLLRCPICATQLRDWQGKDGPNCLLLWEEGRARPVFSDDDNPDRIVKYANTRLTHDCEIYSFDCAAHEVIAIARVVDDTWVKTEIVRVVDVITPRGSV
jgi:hypothetical protein